MRLLLPGGLCLGIALRAVLAYLPAACAALARAPELTTPASSVLKEEPAVE